MNSFKQIAIVVLGIPLMLFIVGLPLFATYALVTYGGVPGWLALPLGGVLVTAAFMLLAASVGAIQRIRERLASGG